MGFIHIPVSVSVIGLPGLEHRYEDIFLIDTGALDSMAPASKLRKAGIKQEGQKTYELADGSFHEFSYGYARVEFMNEITVGRILFGPEDTEPILGVMALEAAGITIDPTTHTLKKATALRLKAAVLD